jgi:hypothetical protein
MFERFARDARAAVLEAAEAGTAAHAARIGRPHLLIGLAAGNEPSLVATGLTAPRLRELLTTLPRSAHAADAEALSAIGVDLDKIRDSVETTFGPGSWERGDPARRRRRGWLERLVQADRPPFTPGAKKVLELGLREALLEGSREITSTHLLRGLVRDPGPEATALIEAVLPLAQLRAKVQHPPAA